MKAVALFFILILAAHVAGAKCYTSGIQCWPKSKTVKQNAVFVVEGYANSQGIIKGLGASYVAFLQSKTQRVPLVVAEILVGQFDVTQAVLKSSRALEVGEQYELIIEGKGSKGNIIRWQDVFRQNERQYTVVAGLDQTAPAWQTLPKENGKSYTEMGCGPEVFVAFASTVRDESEYMLKASVKDLASGKTTAYYLKPDSAGLVQIGHGMCGGPFVLEKGKSFSVTLSLMDASGNTTKWLGNALSFTGPEGSYSSR